MSADPAAAPSGVVTFLFTDIEGTVEGVRMVTIDDTPDEDGD